MRGPSLSIPGSADWLKRMGAPPPYLEVRCGGGACMVGLEAERGFILIRGGESGDPTRLECPADPSMKGAAWPRSIHRAEAPGSSF
jgi:hypothetical protein